MNTFAVSLLLALMSLASCERFDKRESLNLPKGCPSEAVALAAEFMAHDCKYLSTPKCLEDYFGCMKNKSINLEDPIAICAAQLRMPELADTAKYMTTACDVQGLDYFKTLQVFCCAKTHEASLNRMTWTQVRDANQQCMDKNNCPQQ